MVRVFHTSLSAAVGAQPSVEVIEFVCCDVTRASHIPPPFVGSCLRFSLPSDLVCLLVCRISSNPTWSDQPLPVCRWSACSIKSHTYSHLDAIIERICAPCCLVVELESAAALEHAVAVASEEEERRRERERKRRAAKLPAPDRDRENSLMRAKYIKTLPGTRRRRRWENRSLSCKLMVLRLVCWSPTLSVIMCWDVISFHVLAPY